MTNKQQAFIDLVTKLEGDLASNKRTLATDGNGNTLGEDFKEYLEEQVALYRIALGALYRQLGPGVPEVKS